jgi:transcriptional regulator with XRE-family HTH domain
VQLRISQKFEVLRDRFRRPDNTRWNGQQLQDATGGVVTRSYVSMMSKGRIENPGFDKLRAIAKAMGFPPELWFEDVEKPGTAAPAVRGEEHQSIAERVNHLFDTIRNERTGEPYTSAAVARMSLGDLKEDEVEGIRTGRIGDPTIVQILALSEVFGVDPSYFLDRSRKPPLLDREALEALGDQRSRLLLHKSLDLSDREKDMLIDMIEHLGNLRDANETAQRLPGGDR